MKKKKIDIKKILEIFAKYRKLLIISGVPSTAALSILLYFLSVSSSIIIIVIVFVSSFLMFVYFSADYTKFLGIKKAEKNYPDFLEDLAEAKSSGMTMAQSLNSCAGGQYGELMPYIKKMNTNISWGMPFPQAWLKFSEHLKDSRLMARFNTIILESIKSGADTAAILSSLASRASTIRSIEDSRKGIMRQQVVMMYIIFFGFIGIVILLKRILLPTLYIQNLGSTGMDMMGSAAAAGGGVLDSDYFKRLFMLIIFSQSISTGVLIGQILEDKLIGGIKHIAMLLVVSAIVFLVLINPITLEVNQFISKNTPYKGEEINIGGSVNVDGTPGEGVKVNISIEGMETISLTTGSEGRFSKDIIAPSESGTYPVTTVISYQGKKKIVYDAISVQ